MESADLAKTFRKAKFHTHSCELFQGFPCRCFFHAKASPQKCRYSSLSGSVNVAVSLVRRQTFDGLKLRWFISPNPNYHLTFAGLVLSGKSLYSRIPAFVFRGMGGAKVINRQGHASLPSFSALPFKMPRFTSIGTFFR